MIQLTLKTISDFEGQGPYLSAELEQNGERTHTTGIKLNPELLSYTPIGLLGLTLDRFISEEPIPF